MEQRGEFVTKKDIHHPAVKIVGVAVLAIAVIAIIFAVISYANTQHLKRDQLQVVSLSNGQTFFGTLKNTSGDYLTLENPYTLQNLNTDTSESKSGTKVTPTNDQTTLLKVSDQAYGPEGSMAIKSSEIVFWQNLRSDSKVATAIKAKQ